MHILDLFALKKSHCMAGLRVLKPKQSEEGVGVGEPGIGGVGREIDHSLGGQQQGGLGTLL